MHLEAYGPGAGLAFALTGSRFAEVGEIFASDLVGWEVGQFTTAAAVIDKDLEVHLGFSAEFFDIAEELPLVGPDGLAEAFVIVEDGTESEGKYGGMLEAISDHSRMIDAGFLIQSFCRVVFADDNCEVTGWVKENLISTYSVH
jgi:hypothetical protein